MGNTKFVIGQEPKQAVEFLYQKKLLAQKIFKKELWDSALARATTISHLSSLSMTTEIYAQLEEAMRTGKPFAQFKKDVVAVFEKKGWVYGHDKNISRGIDGKLIGDPKTGEHFGTPRRLNTIYRTNMQQAYAAARYQRYMDNVDNRPYWQYSAMGDQRTRPAHQALNGRIYRYDDPFWATFYPPNGFNCRCTVIALGERDLKRRGIESVGSSEGLLVKAKRPKDKQGKQETTVGLQLPDGTIRLADKGFDYNVGRLTYRPNLDLYPEKLAHQFAKVEMAGGEFNIGYERIERELEPYVADYSLLKTQNEREKFLKNIRMNLDRNFKFAAGVLNENAQTSIKTTLKTVWLSDDTLIKQVMNRKGQFAISDYQILPEVLNSPDTIKPSKDNHFELRREVNGKVYVAVIKVLEQTKEIFLQSFRRDSAL